jgi:hypothetical protein
MSHGHQVYQKAWVTAFWYDLDRISTKQPSEETADSAANHGSHWPECGPKRGPSGGAAGDFIEMPHRAANLIKLFVAEQHWRRNRMICSVRHCFAPSFCVAAGRH